PPSQEFQFRVIVARITTASSTTSRGMPYFRRFALERAEECSGSGFCADPVVEGVLSAAIVNVPRRTCRCRMSKALPVPSRRDMNPHEKRPLIAAEGRRFPAQVPTFRHL